MTAVISNDISQLDPNFKVKFQNRRPEVLAKYPNARVFEARRTLERQKRLYASGRTRPGRILTQTMNSKHLAGKAVDVVFLNEWQPTRNGPYDDLIIMAKKYGIKNLKPFETCHFEDDGSVYNPIEKVEKPTEQEKVDTPLVAIWIRNGLRPHDPATRYEVALMLERTIKLLQNKS